VKVRNHQTGNTVPQGASLWFLKNTCGTNLSGSYLHDSRD
jgi:hypothetical protein